ncbi:MAG: hypothetical protein RMM28_11225 [Thermoleophilia bacterium]|nr:hypothetical protein [Gaiellaceae bacterium]MDW8339698.1 hypothetical protein [Thermoleophilia bacterium]
MGACAASAALALTLVPLAAGTEQTFPGRTGEIAFFSNRDGDLELYLANADGSNVRKLLSRPGTDESHPNWSPSGNRLVFTTGPPDQSEFDIWIVNADGTGAQPLVTGSTKDLWAQFCSERTVVFTRQHSASAYDLYAVDVDGTSLRQLTSEPGIELWPTCHPSGNRLAFVSNRDGATRIWEMGLDGSGLRRLVSGIEPDYAPDGGLLAFTGRDPADGNLEIFTIDLNTNEIVQRTRSAPPGRYRIPKFATEARSDQSGPSPFLWATYLASEQVHAVDANGNAQPRVDPGAGGAPRPRPQPKPEPTPKRCECEEVTVKTRSVTVGSRSWGFTVDWTLTCKGDRGLRCQGQIELLLAAEDLTITSPRPRRGQGARPLRISCNGRCGTKPSKGSARVSGNARTSLLPKSRAGQTYQFSLRLFCGERLVRSQAVMVSFDARGRLDRKKSDLNANGTQDGKERR